MAILSGYPQPRIWLDGIKQTDLDVSLTTTSGAANIARNPNYRVGSKIDNAEYFGGDIGESFSGVETSVMLSLLKMISLTKEMG